jgi:hypothetical protein
MGEAKQAGRTTYAPFVFADRGEHCQLLLSDDRMLEKCPIFEEHDGWLGNGYDWTSVARTAVAEQLPHLQAALSFDPEAGMFAAYGPRPAVQSLAATMSAVFHDAGKLRDLLARSELD